MPRQAFLVEDSPAVREQLSSALQALADTEVFAFAETEQDAIAWLKANPDTWQLAVVDLFLRQGTGLGVLAEAQALCSDHQQVVVFTNHATPEIRARCMRLGASAVYDKADEIDSFLAFCAAAAASA